MNGERVGLWSNRNGVHELVYDEQWAASPRGRPLSLSLPIVPGNVPHRGDTVRTFFENLLPDRPDVRNRIRDRFRAASSGAFDLLAEIGRDCVGAVQLLHPDEEPPIIQTIEGIPLSDDDVARHLEAASGLRLPGFDFEDFRIFLGPQGTYRLAPLYDILSVYPWMGNGVDLIYTQKLKMAMAVRSKNTHYRWNTIRRHHWEETARRNGLSHVVDTVIPEVIDRTPQIVGTVRAELPPDFPEQIASSIFDGLEGAVKRLGRAAL